MKNICTPRTPDGRRLEFQLAPGEQDKMGRGRDWTATLKLKDGRTIKVKGAACDLTGCFCDAILIQGPTPRAPRPRRGTRP